MAKNSKLVMISLFCFFLALSLLVTNYIKSLPIKKESVLMSSVKQTEDILYLSGQSKDFKIPIETRLSFNGENQIRYGKTINVGVIEELLLNKRNDFLFFDNLKKNKSIVKVFPKELDDGIKIFYQKEKVLTDIILKNNVSCYEIKDESNIVFNGLKIDKINYCYLANNLIYAKITSSLDSGVEDIIVSNYTKIYSIEKDKDVKVITVKSLELESKLLEFKTALINNFKANDLK